jgi:hypothetical protein
MPIEVKALPADEYKVWVEAAREEFAMNETVPVIGDPETIVLASAE